ncbi:MAG: amidohydrolase, partial [Woeseiales bacterium]
MGIRTVIALGLLTPLAAVFAQDSNDVVDLIDSRYESTAKIARDIWEYAEVGYQETKSSNLLQTTLSAEGFSIQAGVANIPTAFVATYGSGEPVIAILAEFDALPGINQDSVPTRLLIDEKAAGHACGHNLFAAGSIGAAIAVKHWLEESGSSGTLKLLGTPAEEGGSGKVYMVRDGLFDDVDVALTWHPGDNNSASASTTLANRSGKFRFRGISAHAAAAPE